MKREELLSLSESLRNEKLIPLQSQLLASYDRLRNRIAAACAFLKRDPVTVTLIVVTKGRPAESISLLAEHRRHLDFGENYVQELVLKAEVLPQVRWHFLGALQSNKLKSVARWASGVHSLSSLSQAENLVKALKSVEGHVPFPYSVYIQVKCSSRIEKHGLSFEEAPLLAQEVRARFSGVLNVSGVMAIPDLPECSVSPWSLGDPLPPVYEALSKLSSQVGEGGLSLGMSGDLEMALQAGSTMVRVGRALFS